MDFDQLVFLTNPHPLRFVRRNTALPSVTIDRRLVWSWDLRNLLGVLRLQTTSPVHQVRDCSKSKRLVGQTFQKPCGRHSTLAPRTILFSFIRRSVCSLVLTIVVVGSFSVRRKVSKKGYSRLFF